MKIVLESIEEEELIRKANISIDELVMLFNQHDLDRNIEVLVDVGVFS